MPWGRTGLLLPIILGVPLAAPAFAAGADYPNPARGRRIFQQNCALCHSAGAEERPTAGQGPLLAGVMGRRAGARADFGYTRALRGSGIVWNATALDRFLTAPSRMVPGTNMVARIEDNRDRADLVAYLATLGPPAPATPRRSVAGRPRLPTPGDWENDAPGVFHRVDLAVLPAPYVTLSAGNGPHIVDRPPGAFLSVPAGFKVERIADGLSGPRLLRAAPNGDIFIAETRMDRLRVVRLVDGTGAVLDNRIFSDDLQAPFGIAFYPLGPNPQWIYVANLNSVVRFPYRNGDLSPRGPSETVVPRLTESTGAHTTRDVAFSPDGRRLFIAVGSGSNVGQGVPAKSPAEIRAWESEQASGADWGYETHRANILETDPDGRAPVSIFATGIRNGVSIVVQPGTGDLWTAANERDGLGDDLVPDYITRVRRGGYYGWPWYYMGNHEDPRHAGERPDLAGVAIVPDLPLQSHSAPLQMTFYPLDPTGPSAFPAEYRGDIFCALHGSWNRSTRTGTKVVRVHLSHGRAAGGYEDFMTGFVVDNGHVWGRPVGVTVARDGSLLVTDDANGTLWRISYPGKQHRR